jgi:hypothetical protein
MNNPDHISESLETIFWGCRSGTIRNGKNSDRDGKNSDPGSGITIPDPQHWVRQFVDFRESDYYVKKRSGSVSDPGAGQVKNSPDPHNTGPVLRIRDVYPGSRILIFTHSRSRISDPGSKNSNKREG